MNKMIMLYASLVLSTLGMSQDLAYEAIDWQDSPEWNDLDSNYQKELEVMLKYDKIIEYTYSEKYNDRLVEYMTVHKVIKVYGDDAIQNNNKVYIGMYQVIELVEAKARVITPDGEVINFDESNIFDNDSEDGSSDYKFFAIDGIVKGSDIEYTYTVLRVPSYNGVRQTFQDDYIKENVDFTLVAPSNLGFAFKGYNGVPAVVKDSSETEKNIYQVHFDSIPALKDEDYMAYDRSLKHLVYKLDENYYSGATNLISFGEVSQNIYNSYYKELSGGDRKKLKKFIKASGAYEASSEVEKIRLLENHIKTTLGVIDGAPLKSIKGILFDGFTSKRGVSYLMIQALKLLEIKHEFVLTCDRVEDIFDKDFEHYQVLQNAIIYFPKLKQYVAPSEQLFRLGIIPSDWTNQYGLFIKEVSVGGMATGLGKVKFIEPVSEKATMDIMDVEVDLSELSAPTVNFKRTLSGYSCVYFQVIYELLEDADKKDLDEAYIKFADENGEIENYEISGVDAADFGVNPVVYTGTLKTSSIMEKAGKRYLFKVGELIGPQAEMYQETERVTDIDHDHNMIYSRTIKFVVPEGYEVSGLDAININENYPAEDPMISFVSSYTQNGNTIEIKVVETYKQMAFDKSEINDFRRIINAAANFNKVVLFINKV